MPRITIIPNDPHYDLCAWMKEKNDAKIMSEAHYRQAILTNQDTFKIGFFDTVKRMREIEIAIEKYLA